MIYILLNYVSNQNREDLENLNELASLQDQVNEIRLQDKLGEQNYHRNRNKLLEPMADAIKNTSEKITKTLTENSIKNNKATESLNEKILELMNDKGMIAPYLASSLVNFFKPGNKSQFKFKKDLKSTKMNDFLIYEGLPVILFSNVLIFSDSNKSFKLDGDLLETMTNYDFNVSFSKPKDQKLIYEFPKETKFDLKQRGRKSARDKSIIRLLKSPAIMASAVKTTIPSENPDELFDRMKLLLQESKPGINSDLSNKEIVAIVDK